MKSIQIFFLIYKKFIIIFFKLIYFKGFKGIFFLIN